MGHSVSDRNHLQNWVKYIVNTAKYELIHRGLKNISKIYRMEDYSLGSKDLRKDLRII